MRRIGSIAFGCLMVLQVEADPPSPQSASAGGEPAVPAQAAPDSIPRARAQKLFADIGKIVSPEGVDTAQYVTLGKARQWITVRGQNRHAPILLFLHGGPGGALSDVSYAFQRPWEDYFTVVQWDQRGFGRSNVDIDALKGTLNKEQVISDAMELIAYLRAYYKQPKLVLVGQSWGTIVGLEVAKRRPDLLYAFVAIGQQTSYEPSFAHTRELLLQLARSESDKELEATMLGVGEIPSARDWERFRPWIDTVQGAMTARGYSWHNAVGPDGWGSRVGTLLQMSPTVDSKRMQAAMTDATFIERQGEVVGSISGWNAYKDVGTRLRVPYVVVAGTYDWQTPIDLARAYYNDVCAPWKQWVEFQNSAHAVLLEEPGRLLVTLVESALPAAQGRRPKGVSNCKQL